MGRVVIVAMKPKSGCEQALKDLLITHHAQLREQQLVSDRKPVIVEAEAGTIIEVFEWLSKEAIKAAHTNPAVNAMWAQYAEVCDFVPVGTVSEAQELFSEFSPLN